jgi:hypothetical protein
MVQGGGAGMLVSSKDSAGFQRGENIILAGLVLQIALFGLFVVVAGMWHRRLLARPTSSSAEVKWQGMMGRLYAASGCIMLRNVFRVVEYGMGQVRSLFFSFSLFENISWSCLQMEKGDWLTLRLH